MPKPRAKPPAVRAAIVHNRYEGDLPVAWKYVHCAGYDLVNGEKMFHHFSNKDCDCPPGPQHLALVADVDELAMGGGRGSLKTETGFPFSTRGNGIPNATDPTDITYINNRLYRFLVLRRNVKDLDDWFRRGKQFYGTFGAQPVESPILKFRFPSGAECVLDHMQDESAYEKYQGQEFQSIIFEEATQTPTEELFEKILGSCRSTVKGIRAKAFITANPGGVGHRWFVNRYLESRHADGRKVKPGEVWADPKTGRTRMFLHSTVYDNPYYLTGKADYVRYLESLSERLRRMWLYGDFSVPEGQFFNEFRASRYPDEPEQALHVYKRNSIELLPWWPRWIAVDWGYAHWAAVYWFCQHPDGRIIVYREYVERNVGSFELGAKIARASRDDLSGLNDRHMMLHLSPDAYARKDATNTIAEQIIVGIASELGAAVMADLSPWPEDRSLSGLPRITVQRANNERVAGWNYIRDLLRWWPIGESEQVDLLPRVLISDGCPRLIDGLQAAVADPDHPEDVLKQEGDDPIDAFRYGTSAHREARIRVPKYAFMEGLQKKVEQAYPDDINIRMQMIRHQTALYDRQNRPVIGLNFPREASMRWRQ